MQQRRGGFLESEEGQWERPAAHVSVSDDAHMMCGLSQESTAPQRRDGEAAEATAAPAGRKTLDVVSGAERIADALALVAAEAERVQVRSLAKLAPETPDCTSRTALSPSRLSCGALRLVPESTCICALPSLCIGGDM